VVAESLTLIALFVLLASAAGLAIVLRSQIAIEKLMAVQLLGTGGAATLLLLGAATAQLALADASTLICVVAGAVLFLAGTLGLLRFPDTLSRLHALSKADNLGLGLIVLGLMPQQASLMGGAKLVCIWLLAQLSAATASQLIAGIAARRKPQA